MFRRIAGSRPAIRTGAVVAMALALLIGTANPSSANSGTIRGSNSHGNGWVSWSTGTYLTLNVNATDTSCNGKGFQTSVTIHMDGIEDTINRSGGTTQGCNTSGGITESLTASQLRGKRSGYLEMRLCHKVAIGWSCGGVVNSAFWNF
jgi:hypothetical protein